MIVGIQEVGTVEIYLQSSSFYALSSVYSLSSSWSCDDGDYYSYLSEEI